MADRKKKRSTDDSDEFLKDSYDMSVFAGRHDICAMCKGGYNMGLSLIRNFSLTDEDDADEDQTTLANSILDLDGVWASKYGIRISKTRSVFVHFHCAHYSPRSWFDGANWYNLGKEVVRSGCLACSHCGRKGASLGCSVKKCKNVMHIPCAIQSGYGRNNLRGRYYCITHTKQREKDEIKEDEEYMQDLSNGKEPIPILFPRRHRADPMIAQIFDDFEYTMQNLDSDDVSAKSEGVGSLACCTCEGLCDDVATCACLQEGKNYTYQGTAIPGLTRPIIECNLKCACSIRYNT